MSPSDNRQHSWQGWQREQRNDLTVSEARHILWERRLLVAGCTLFFVAVALLYALSREPVYTAEATILVRSEEGEIKLAGSLNEILFGLGDPKATEGFLNEAAARAGWKGEPGEFRERIWEEQQANGRMKVRFYGRTPREAAQGANAYADVFVERIREFEGRLAGGTASTDAEVEKAAVPPERRSGPGVLLTLAAAGGGGILVGGILALFVEDRARRWSGSRDAELTLRAPVLGVIPDYSSDLPDEIPEEVHPARDAGGGPS
jgi:capsular polysaccharide biosynthesis protein